MKHLLKKSLGFVIPPEFRRFKIPGQVPGLAAMTAMPSRRTKLVDTVHPCFTPGRVVEGLPLTPDWAGYVSKAMGAANELLMRQDLFSRMHEERMEPGLRRELFARSLSLWRELKKSATPIGGKTPGGYTVKMVGGKRVYVKPITERQLAAYKPKAPPLDNARKWARHPKPWSEYVSPGDQIIRIKAHREIRAAIDVRLPASVGWWRATNRQDERNDVAGGLEIRSKNYADGTTEEGMSVSKTPAYVAGAGYRYGYQVTGTVAGIGSDGEPVLTDVSPISPILTVKQVIAVDSGRKKAYQVAIRKIATELKLDVAVINRAYHAAPEPFAKSDPRGGTYVKRVPKSGGGFRYFYDEDKYDAHAGAHVSGPDAATAAITKAVNGHVEAAGKNGCELKAMHPLVKRYGAKMVGGYLNGAVKDGSLVYRGKRLFAKGAVKKLPIAEKKTAKKSGFYLAEPLLKAGPYIGPRGGKWADIKHTIPWKPEQRKVVHETETKEFKKWFGQSQVVDPKGKPLLVYHGTVAGHEVFDASHRGKFTNEDPGARMAFFFTDVEADADYYAVRAVDRSSEYEDPKPRVMQVYLKAENILDADEESLGDLYEDLIESDSDLIDYAQENGYDAVRWPDGNMVNTPGTIAVFDDDQIRVAKQRKVGSKVVKPLIKAHKYIRRVPKPGGGYRYYYAESAAAREAKAGEEIRLGTKIAKVLAVQNGTVTLEIDGKRQTVKPGEWAKLLTRHYGEAYTKSAEKRAQQAINAVMRHVPRALLKDLKGDTDEARLADLEKRVPAVYAKLKAAFSRAGMSPFTAKRSLAAILERRGWEPEARAVAIGSVIQHREIATRDLIRASENLAAGGKVLAGHVAAATELRAPGGKVASFPDETAKLAANAEVELAQLSKMLTAARGDPQMAATVLAQVLASESMQKLALVAQAFPGLQDRAIDPVRKAILRVPTTEGAETVVYVAGEGGAPKALEARYRLVEADTLIASHKSDSFARNPDYPEGVQERAYHRDKAEQAKVIRNAQQMDPRFVVNTNPDAVNGPPMVTPEGIVLGGNSRAMSMQRIYAQHPEKATQMREYLADHAHEVGLKPGDIQAMKNPVLIREVIVEDKSQRGLQILVRQMNESFTQAMDPRTMQVAMGRKLTDQTLATLADSMTEDETLGSFLASGRSERFVASLFRAGIIDNRNVNQYVTKGTRRLNEDGKTLVSRILVGRTVDNADVLSETGAGMMNAIAGAVPSMVQAAGHGKGYDLGDDLSVAVDAFNDLQRRVDQGYLRSLDPKMSARDLSRLYNNFEVLPGIDEPHPVLANERAQVLLEVLIRKRGPVQMAKVFREYAKVAAANPEDQATMFGASVTPIEALRQAVAGPKEPQLSLVASERFVIRRLG